MGALHRRSNSRNVARDIVDDAVMWDHIIPVNYKWTNVWTVYKATHCGHTFVKIKAWFIN